MLLIYSMIYQRTEDLMRCICLVMSTREIASVVTVHSLRDTTSISFAPTEL